MHIADNKDTWRDSMKERLSRMSDEDRSAESRSICRRLLPLIPVGSHVAAYMALKTEPNMDMLLKELLSRGDSVYLPAFEQKVMKVRQVTDLSTLSMGELKILEPMMDAPECDPKKLDIVIVPGRAFSSDGHRLGRGNGGYDMWIEKQRAQNPHTHYWGVAFECQVVGEIPVEPHDQKMDKVITAHGIVGDKS